MKFHIPKQQKPNRERIDLKLERSVLEQLDRYCAYMDSDRDYVVAAVLGIVFKKDKGFAQWQREQALAQTATSDRRAVAEA